MSIFKVQLIRSCRQCGDRLPMRCARCIAHPERQPRVIELYDWPEALAVNVCGCIQIACQATGCTQTMWRLPRRWNKEGMAPYRSFYCSNKCATATSGAKRNTQVEVPCSYCGKQKRVKQFYVRQKRKIFCNPSEYHLWRARNKHDAVEGQKIIEREMEKEALVECGNGCKDITDHVEISKGNYKCKKCGFIRKTPATAGT